MSNRIGRWMDALLRLRDAWLSEQMIRALKAFGRDSQIAAPFDIRGAMHVSIGSGVFIGPRVLMGADLNAPIVIEDFVMLGPDVKLIAGDHRYDLPGILIKDSGVGRQGPIVLRRGSWIGAGSIILKGVEVGEGAIVGAGAVVTRNVPREEIWAGNPARRVNKRFGGGPVG